MASIKSKEVNDICVHGFHVYNNVWRSMIGEELRCQREKDNPRDPYAVAVTKSRTGVLGLEVVGHVPRYLSTLCSLCIRRSGAGICIVTGTCRYLRDLPQGGMEIPCKYRFVSKVQDVKKI